MATVLSSSLAAPKVPGCSPPAIRPTVRRVFKECNVRRSDLKTAANDAVCKLPPSDWVCQVVHRPLLNTLERLEGVLHWSEWISEGGAVVQDVMRHKVRPVVAVAKAVIGSGIRRAARFFGRWLGTAIGAALSPCGCAAIIGGCIGVLAGGLLGAVIVHLVVA